MTGKNSLHPKTSLSCLTEVSKVLKSLAKISLQVLPWLGILSVCVCMWGGGGYESIDLCI